MRSRRWGVLVLLLVLGSSGCATNSTPTASESLASEPTPVVTSESPPRPVPDATSTPSLAPVQPSLEATPGQTVTVTDVIDGDTIDTTAGRIRLIGIDTPERGECNFGPATSQLRSQISAYGNTVVLVPVPAIDDTDRYGRLLRYVDAPDGTDLGRNLIGSGLAIARYDSRDGYGRHPRQDDYVALDAAVPKVPCGGAASNPEG